MLAWLKIRHLPRLLLWSGIAALLLAAACSGLAGEPAIVMTLPPPTAIPAVFPAEPPDLLLGAQIYAARCIRCHGPNGEGNGEMIGSSEGQIPGPIPSFRDPATTRDQTPLDWYTTITNGRLEKLMPPWRESLSDRERWSVALYTYTMSYQPQQIADGQTLWTDAAGSVNSMPPQSRLVNLTNDALLTAALELAGSRAADLIASLDSTQRAAVAAYLRAITLTNTDVIGREVLEVAVAPPQATTEADATISAPPAVTAEAQTFTTGVITGTVTNRTAGATVPSDLAVVLREYDTNFNETTRETVLNADGTFVFADVTLRPDHNYVVTATYQNRLFGSEFVPGSSAALDLPITLYELTDDSSVIQISGMVIQIIAEGGLLQVAQVISFTNTSDRLFTTNQSLGRERFGSVSVPLPAGAQLQSFGSDQGRYTLSDTGDVIDSAPVLPGSNHIVHLLYTLPYSGDLTVEQPVNFAVAGPVRILIAPDSLRVSSSLLPAIGPQTLGSQTYQGYGAELSLPAGQVISYQLQGQPVVSSSSTPGSTAIPSNLVIPILLIVGGFAVIAAGVIIYLRGRSPASVSATPSPPPDTQGLIDGLVRQIAELDDTYNAGTLDEATYQKRRSRLKNRLAELMDNEP